jgi:hypothetical protein
VKKQRLQQIDNAAEEDWTANKIQTLKNMGIHFDEKWNIRNIDNWADRSKIQKFIDEQKTAQQDNFWDNNTTINTSQNLTPETYEDNEVAEVVEVTKDNFRSLCWKEKLPAPQIKKLVDYANKEKMTNLNLNITEIDEDGAKALALYNWDLYLDNITKFTLEDDPYHSLEQSIAEALAQHTQGDLHLGKLESISDDAAKKLANHQWDLRLTCLKDSEGNPSLDDSLLYKFIEHKDKGTLRLSAFYKPTYDRDERQNRFNNTLAFDDFS